MLPDDGLDEGSEEEETKEKDERDDGKDGDGSDDWGKRRLRRRWRPRLRIRWQSSGLPHLPLQPGGKKQESKQEWKASYT